MLTCHTQAQWDLLYNKALREIDNDPDKVDKLIAIGHNPEYYAGYYLKGIEGNMGYLGSTHAEQNHASVKSHLGEGASWSIAEQMTHLFKRQQFLVSKEKEEMNTHCVSTYKYSSMYSGQQGQDDKDTKVALTDYCHEKFFLKGLKRSRTLSH